MNPRILTFQATENNGYTAIFTTDHGRRILLTVHLMEGSFIPTECWYIDRNSCAVPKKFVSKKISPNDLQHVLRKELDTKTVLLTFYVQQEPRHNRQGYAAGRNGKRKTQNSNPASARRLSLYHV